MGLWPSAKTNSSRAWATAIQTRYIKLKQDNLCPYSVVNYSELSTTSFLRVRSLWPSAETSNRHRKMLFISLNQFRINFERNPRWKIMCKERIHPSSTPVASNVNRCSSWAYRQRTEFFAFVDYVCRLHIQWYKSIKRPICPVDLYPYQLDESISEFRSVRVAERLALPTSDHGVAGSNPAGGEILPEPKRRFIAQSLSCSPFHRLEMTEILLKGRKTLTHPSVHFRI